MSDCGCCDLNMPFSPRSIFNRPALSALTYRVGTFSSFRRAMIDAAATKIALSTWTARDDNDYGIAAIELWAYLGDILTFYQERIANEAFLRTAVQRESLAWLAALIDYRLTPGVAATAYLAFSVDKTNPTLAPGTRVQSKSTPGQSPTTFETEGPLRTVAAANQFRVLPMPACDGDTIAPGDSSKYLFADETDLKPGQTLVFFAGDQIEEKTITALTKTEIGTRLEWSPPISGTFSMGGVVYRLGRKYNLFGYNAPATYSASVLDKSGHIVGAQLLQTDFSHGPITTLDLDGAQDLKTSTPVLVVIGGRYAGLFSITAASQIGQKLGLVSTGLIGSAHSGTATQILLQPLTSLAIVPRLEDIRAVQVYELTIPEITFSPLGVREQHGRIIGEIEANSFRVFSTKIRPSDLTIGGLALLVDPDPQYGKAEQVTITNVDSFMCNGIVSGVTIEFTPPCQYYYPAGTAVMYGNIAKATHGETIKDEMLGSGDGRQAFQAFRLKKSPVTFTPDTMAERGALNSLHVMVNGERWKEAQDFFGRSPDEHIYVTSIAADDTMQVVFGDGVHGARLPSGANNVHARYRKGWGKTGAVGAYKLTTLLDLKPGVKAVTNPMPGFGWSEPESPTQVRQNAPKTVLTFERAVSFSDFENLARSFPGVGKAHAAWVWDSEQQVIRLTCMASDGGSILPIRPNLLAYLNMRRDPNQPLDIVDAQLVEVQLHAYVVVHPDYDADAVLANAQAAVGPGQLPDDTYGFFAFERLDLDEDIHLSELYAVLQSVPGVVAVDIDVLHRKDMPGVTLQNIVPIGPSELATVEHPLAGASILDDQPPNVSIELRGQL